jgi:lysophospholipase L1-like esterase
LEAVAVRLIVLGLGFVVATLLAETAVRLIAPQPLQHIQLDDQLYFVNRPGARFRYAKEGEYAVDIVYNAWGYRGPIPGPSPAPDTTRILLIGDSQTEGLQVRYEETYGAVLGRALEGALPGRRFEVVNLGVSAYGTHQEVLTLRRYGARVRPCWVVLGLYPGNDLFDNVRWPLVVDDADGIRLVEHRFSFARRLWLGTKIRLASVSHLYTLSAAQLKALLSRPLLTRVGVLEPAAPDVEMSSRPLRVTEHLLRLARDGARNLDARLVVLVIPERSQVMRAEGSPPTGLDDIEQHFIAWFAREGILHVEALASLRGALRRGEDVFFQRDGHLNAAGHRVVGELLARQLAPLLGREPSGYSGACTGELSVREAPTR